MSATRLVDEIATRLDGSPLALLLDIDGTLAPIAPTPDAAALPPDTRETLDRLVRLPDVRVVLVTGRSVDDAWRLAQIEGAWIVGNHGLEMRNPDGLVTMSAAARRYEDAVARAAASLAPVAAAIEGALIENKRWSLSVHYRLVNDSHVPDLIATARRVAAEVGLRATGGKKIVELRPPVDVNKGTAVLQMAARFGAFDRGGSVLYAGDDATDEDAFEALRGRSDRAVTLRVGELGAAAERTATRAEFVLESPAQLRELLERLAARRAAQES